MAKDETKDYLRRLPSVTELLKDGGIGALLARYPHSLVVEAIQGELAFRRERLRLLPPDEASDLDTSQASIAAAVCRSCNDRMRQGLRRVVNGTGVVLHTNLGRAVLPATAVDRLLAVAGTYTNLELDLTTGERGLRYEYIESLLCTLTGAESALVVNNNAAAVLLALGTLARQREAIVSRGQLVEIGGSFRVPDVMEQSGVILREVGTTNKTHPADYRRAIGPDTALLLRVHSSNFKMIGFTEEVSLPELVRIGQEYHLPVLDDLGSGGFLDFTPYGLGYEPTVTDSVRAGAAVITFSGDKLLGGPQAGIIIGKKVYLDRMKQNPLLRAFRIDKLTLAALEVVLEMYLQGDDIREKIPTLWMLTRPLARLEAEAGELAAGIAAVWDGQGKVEVIDGYSQAGGGSLPGEDIPTRLVAVAPRHLTVNQVEARLRAGDPPIMTRIGQGRLLIDPRTLLEGDREVIAAAFAGIREID